MSWLKRLQFLIFFEKILSKWTEFSTVCTMYHYHICQQTSRFFFFIHKNDSLSLITFTPFGVISNWTGVGLLDPVVVQLQSSSSPSSSLFSFNGGKLQGGEVPWGSTISCWLLNESSLQRRTLLLSTWLSISFTKLMGEEDTSRIPSSFTGPISVSTSVVSMISKVSTDGGVMHGFSTIIGWVRLGILFMLELSQISSSWREEEGSTLTIWLTSIEGTNESHAARFAKYSLWKWQ